LQGSTKGGMEKHFLYGKYLRWSAFNKGYGNLNIFFVFTFLIFNPLSAKKSEVQSEKWLYASPL